MCLHSKLKRKKNLLFCSCVNVLGSFLHARFDLERHHTEKENTKLHSKNEKITSRIIFGGNQSQQRLLMCKTNKCLQQIVGIVGSALMWNPSRSFLYWKQTIHFVAFYKFDVSLGCVQRPLSLKPFTACLSVQMKQELGVMRVSVFSGLCSSSTSCAKYLRRTSCSNFSTLALILKCISQCLIAVKILNLPFES